MDDGVGRRGRDGIEREKLVLCLRGQSVDVARRDASNGRHFYTFGGADGSSRLSRAPSAEGTPRSW